MFGTWISQIQADLRKEFPATADYGRADFMRNPMPVSIGHFLEHALARRAAMIQASVDPAWFDVLNQDVIESEKRWRETLVAASRYPKRFWDQSIDQAVAHVVSFLVSPADSFCDFVFANTKGDVAPAIILQRLVYFRPYSALREVIKGWAEQKGAEPVSREDLRAAILQADRSIVANYEPSDWIALLRPLYDLAEVMVPGDGVPEVPTSLLKPVFEAKAADDLVRRIEAIESVGGRRKLSESSLLTVISPMEAAPVAAPVAEAVVSEQGSSESSETVAESRPLQLNDMHTQSAVKAMPRWMQFTARVETPPVGHTGDGGPSPAIQPDVQLDVQPDVQPAVPVDARPSVQVTIDANEDVGIPMPSRVGERALLPHDNVVTDAGWAVASHPTMSESGALSDVNPVQRAWFVNNLFGGDSEDFSRVMLLIDGAGDWEEAAHVIGAEVFERHDVDIYSQPAIEFTNAVESKYL